MSKVSYRATLHYHDYKVIAVILQYWLGIKEIRTRVRLYGEEIDYETEDRYLWCYSTGGDNDNFLLQGHFPGNISQGKLELQSLADVLRQHNISYSFEYIEMDSDDNEVGDEYELEWSGGGKD